MKISFNYPQPDTPMQHQGIENDTQQRRVAHSPR